MLILIPRGQIDLFKEIPVHVEIQGCGKDKADLPFPVQQGINEVDRRMARVPVDDIFPGGEGLRGKDVPEILPFRDVAFAFSL